MVLLINLLAFQTFLTIYLADMTNYVDILNESATIKCSMDIPTRVCVEWLQGDNSLVETMHMALQQCIMEFATDTENTISMDICLPETYPTFKDVKICIEAANLNNTVPLISFEEPANVNEVVDRIVESFGSVVAKQFIASVNHEIITKCPSAEQFLEGFKFYSLFSRSMFSAMLKNLKEKNAIPLFSSTVMQHLQEKFKTIRQESNYVCEVITAFNKYKQQVIDVVISSIKNISNSPMDYSAPEFTNTLVGKELITQCKLYVDILMANQATPANCSISMFDFPFERLKEFRTALGECQKKLQQLNDEISETRRNKPILFLGKEMQDNCFFRPHEEVALPCLGSKCKHISSVTNMAECDQCHRWYHVECVKLTLEQADVLKTWACSNCNCITNSPTNKKRPKRPAENDNDQQQQQQQQQEGSKLASSEASHHQTGSAKKRNMGREKK